MGLKQVRSEARLTWLPWEASVCLKALCIKTLYLTLSTNGRESLCVWGGVFLLNQRVRVTESHHSEFAPRVR